MIRTALIALLTATFAACGGGEPEAPATSCTPVVVVQMFGDSTMAAQGNAVQRFMDAEFGAGRVSVENLGASGTTAANFNRSLVKPGAVVLVNYGINDKNHGLVDLPQYRSTLTAISADVYQTPNPPIDDYAQGMRETAQALGRPVIDVAAFVHTIPDWRSHTPDGVHPDAWLYEQIATRVTGPGLAAIVRGSVCRA